MSGKITKGIIVTLLLSLLYYGYILIQNNTSKYTQFEHAIDSLSGEITKLDSAHIKQDSTITLYKDSVVYLDNIIVEEKIKYTEIKHKFNEKRTHITNYTPTQLDSFFSKRYGQFESDLILPGS
jgi:hypothetical protein